MTLPTPIGHQADVLYLAPKGHVLVLGTAGSGKTTLAIHRAVRLSDPALPGGGRTLLLTFNKALVAYLRQLRPAEPRDLTIENYHKFARGYLARRGKMSQNAILDATPRLRLIGEAVATVRGQYRPHSLFDRPLAFFGDEIHWMASNGLFDLDSYLAAERVGRNVGLHPTLREPVFRIAVEYRRLRVQHGKNYDWDELASAVRQELAVDDSPRRYRHIVIDEGQDFSPEMIKSLVAAADPEGSVTFFGDYAQQIYGQRLSWQSFGLRIRGNVWKFTENYRNTTQIARVALAMSALPHFRDSPDLVEPKNPTAAGPLPALVCCTSRDAELDFAAEQAQRLGRTQSVAVLFRDRADEARVARRLPAAAIRLDGDLERWNPAPGVRYGTYHSAKGLEFDAVILPHCSADRLPDPDAVVAFGIDEAMSREARLLYVGVTRARSTLIITHAGAVTPLLPTEPGLFDVRSVP